MDKRHGRGLVDLGYKVLFSGGWSELDVHLVNGTGNLSVSGDYLAGEEVYVGHLFSWPVFKGIVEVREFGSPSSSSGIRGIVLFEGDQGLMVGIDGEVVTIVEVMAELEGSPYYCKAFFFCGGPVYFTFAEGSSGV